MNEAELHQYEKLVIKALEQGSNDIESIAKKTNLSKDSVMRACYWLKEKGAVDISEKVSAGYILTEEGKEFLENNFPEIRILVKLGERGGDISLLDAEERRVGLAKAREKRFIDVRGGAISLTQSGKDLAKNPLAYDLYNALLAISKGEKAREELVLELLRRGQIVRREKKDISVSLTDFGKELARISKSEGEVNILTKEMITSGRWRDVKLRRYDVCAPVEEAEIGKLHPITMQKERIRRIFLEMGFEEMEGPIVELSFWNFDSLFQPQDHPARELADTFYLDLPEGTKTAMLPTELVEKVKKAHEKGWGYKWRESEAKKFVLRTHTTAVSARYLAKVGEGNKKAPARYFSVGKVFRNEAIDFKHLAEFYQVEGIIVWEKATFRDLLGCLRDFYKKLGFERIRFMPSYFPYTEPSLEVEVFFEKRGEWLELGGAGVFRPEVCLPLWGKFPVLAWGLSLERPLMLERGIEDIRTPYKNDLRWLRGTRAQVF
ncbi:MAG: phenylalanine--tRNA ligase subunit alpha [Candidatus Micrarchaeia archaeon]